MCIFDMDCSHLSQMIKDQKWDRPCKPVSACSLFQVKSYYFKFQFYLFFQTKEASLPLIVSFEEQVLLKAADQDCPEQEL